MKQLIGVALAIVLCSALNSVHSAVIQHGNEFPNGIVLSTGGSNGCNSSNEGAVDYDPSTKLLRVCTGNSWAVVGGSSAPTTVNLGDASVSQLRDLLFCNGHGTFVRSSNQDGCMCGSCVCFQDGVKGFHVGDECESCSSGYEVDENGACTVDIDECALPNACALDGATCTNTPGSYDCSCGTGYEVVGQSCLDIDECASEELNTCSDVCVNEPGSFHCECPTGYTLLPSGQCVLAQPFWHWTFDDCTSPTQEISGDPSLAVTLDAGGSGTYTSTGSCDFDDTTMFGAGSRGKLGSGIAFDGTDATARTANSIASKSMTHISISGWVKPSTESHGPVDWTLFGVTTSTDYGLVFRCYIPNAQNQFRCGQRVPGSVSWEAQSGTTNIQDGSWHFVVGTMGAGSMNIYVDGALEGSRSVSSTTLNFVSPVIFFGHNFEGSSSFFYKGILDDVRVFDRVVSQAEISAMYDAGRLALASFEHGSNLPLHYWDMETTTVNGGIPEYVDLVGGNNLVRYENGAASATVVSEADCPVGSCSGVTHCNDFFLSLGDFDPSLGGAAAKSIATWQLNLNTRGDGGDKASPGLGFGGYDGSDPGTCTCSSFHATYVHNTGAGPRMNGCGCDRSAAITINSGVWYHHVIAYNGTHLKMYVDGATDPSWEWDLSLNTNVNAGMKKFVVGADSWWGTAQHRMCNGYVDDLRVYDYALTDEHVAELYGLRQPMPAVTETVYASFESGPKLPLHYWDMHTESDGNLLLVDAASAASHMEATGDGYYKTSGCPVGHCIRLDSCNTFFSSLNDWEAQLGGSSSKSLTAWVKLLVDSPVNAGWPHTNAPIAGFGSSSPGSGLGTDCTCSSFNLVHHQSGGAGIVHCGCDISSGTIFNVGDWHFMAMTFDGTTSSLYLDAGTSPDISEPRSVNVRGTMKKFVIGADAWWRTQNHRLCQAEVDDVRVYDFALSGSEVQELFQLGFA